MAAGYSRPGRNASSSFGGTAEDYESASYGTIRFDQAPSMSCDTVFYKFAYDTWLRRAATPAHSTKDPFTEMAKAFGLGKTTGLDLPGESDGRIADRPWKRAYWEATKDFYCKRAEETRLRASAYLMQLSRENCVDGCLPRR